LIGALTPAAGAGAAAGGWTESPWATGTGWDSEAILAALTAAWSSAKADIAEQPNIAIINKPNHFLITLLLSCVPTKCGDLIIKFSMY
jgi:hypothetical protein